MEITSQFNAHLDHSNVVAAAFTGKANTFITANKDGTMTYVTFAPKFRQRSCKITSQQFTTMAYNDNCDKIILGTSIGDIYILSKKFDVLEILHNKHSSRITKIEFIHHFKYFITASQDGSMKIFSVKTYKYVKSYYDHQGCINDFDVSPNGAMFITACTDKKLRIFELKSKQCCAVIGPFPSVPTSIKFHYDGDHYFVGFTNGVVACYKTKSGKKAMSIRLHDASVSNLCLHGSGVFLASVSVDSTLSIIEVKGGKVIYKLLIKQKGLNSVNFSPDGWIVMTTSVNGRVTIWDFPYNKLVVDLKTETTTSSDNNKINNNTVPQNSSESNSAGINSITINNEEIIEESDSSFPEVAPDVDDTMKAQTVPIPIQIPAIQPTPPAIPPFGFTHDQPTPIYLAQESNIKLTQGKVKSLSQLGPNPYEFSDTSTESFKSVDAQEVEEIPEQNDFSTYTNTKNEESSQSNIKENEYLPNNTDSKNEENVHEMKRSKSEEEVIDLVHKLNELAESESTENNKESIPKANSNENDDTNTNCIPVPNEEGDEIHISENNNKLTNEEQNEKGEKKQNEHHEEEQNETSEKKQNEHHEEEQNETSEKKQNEHHEEEQNETSEKKQNEHHEEEQNETSEKKQNEYHEEEQNETSEKKQNEHHEEEQNETSEKKQNEYHEEEQNETSEKKQNEYHEEEQNETSEKKQNEYHEEEQNETSEKKQNEHHEEEQNETSEKKQNEYHEEEQNETSEKKQNEYHEEEQIEEHGKVDNEEHIDKEKNEKQQTQIEENEKGNNSINVEEEDNNSSEKISNLIMEEEEEVGDITDNVNDNQESHSALENLAAELSIGNSEVEDECDEHKETSIDSLNPESSEINDTNTIQSTNSLNEEEMDHLYTFSVTTSTEDMISTSQQSYPIPEENAAATQPVTPHNDIISVTLIQTQPATVNIINDDSEAPTRLSITTL